MRISQNLKMTERLSVIDNRGRAIISLIEAKNNDRTDRVIRYGRLGLALIIIGNITSMIIYLSIEEVTLDVEGRHKIKKEVMEDLSWCFYALSGILFFCVFWLVSRLKKKRD